MLQTAIHGGEVQANQSAKATDVHREGFVADYPRGANDSARDEAWLKIKDILGAQAWTVGEVATYRGFFNWGWDERRLAEKSAVEPSSMGHIERRYIGTRMVLCPRCGNKRCPHANDPSNKCTNSNAWGQPGSAYPAAPEATTKAEPFNEWEAAVRHEMAGAGLSFPAEIPAQTILRALIARRVSMVITQLYGAPATDGSSQAQGAPLAGCGCQACRPITLSDMRMVLCEICGNKRCPHAANHLQECTGSNEPGQPGSAYPAIGRLMVPRD